MRPTIHTVLALFALGSGCTVHTTSSPPPQTARTEVTVVQPAQPTATATAQPTATATATAQPAQPTATAQTTQTTVAKAIV